MRLMETPRANTALGLRDRPFRRRREETRRCRRVAAARRQGHGVWVADLVWEGDGRWRVTLATTADSSGMTGQPTPVKDMRVNLAMALRAAGKPVF